jgi:hypothetical protein
MAGVPKVREPLYVIEDTYESHVAKSVEFGAMIAGWFRCNLNKQTANGNSAQYLVEITNKRIIV